MTAVDRVRLAQELAAVVAAIWFDIDHGDGSGVSAHFTAGATLTIFARSFYGREQIDDAYAARVTRAPRVTRHLTTNLHLVDATDTSAEVVSSLCLFAEDGVPPRPRVVPMLVGDVADRMERHGGRWLISSRHVRQIFVAPDAVFAVPTS